MQEQLVFCSRLADKEISVIRRFLKDAVSCVGSPVLLDVGCGYGRNLENLRGSGLSLVGVDANADAVEHNKRNGFECYLPDDDQWKREYDCILMSHIIEHFSPSDLFHFMESYLARLKPGGYLVIATPLLTDYFFDDFTHVKPYHPESVLMVFGDGNPQVSMRSSTKLELRDLWFRTSAYRMRRVKMRYLGKLGRFWPKAVNGLLALVHIGSGGLVGKKDGWVGVFQKIG